MWLSRKRVSDQPLRVAAFVGRARCRARGECRRKEVSGTLRSASEGTTVGPFSGRLNVNEVPLEFRAFPLQDGKVNVGTIFPLQ